MTVFVALQDGTGALLHLGTGEFVALNATARELFELARRGMDPAGLAAHLGERHELPAEEATDAVRSFLEELGRYVPSVVSK